MFSSYVRVDVELEVPVIAVSQLRRPPATIGKKTPSMEDLRESGAIEQNADLVILIYRPEVDDPRDHELKGIAEVNLAKHRNGVTGQFKLAWIGGEGLQALRGADPMSTTDLASSTSKRGEVSAVWRRRAR